MVRSSCSFSLKCSQPATVTRNYKVCETTSLEEIETTLVGGSKEAEASKRNMAVSQTEETEELLTCLRLQVYHPEPQNILMHLPLNQRLKQEAEDPVRLGRAADACPFVLNDPKASRKQLSLMAFRAPGSTEMRFKVQNLSRKVRLQVNGIELGHLVGAELPDKALIRFGRYELLVLQEPGDCETHFEVLFEWRGVPPSQEMGVGGANTVPVMDSGDATLSWRGPTNVPSESDESESM